MMTQRVAVLGTNSFIGRAFVDYVLAHTEATVLGTSRSPEVHPVFLPYRRHAASRFTFEQVDFLRDVPRLMQLFDSFKPEIVFNFSNPCEVASSWTYPIDYYRVNVIGTTDVAEHIAKRAYIRMFVQTSSPEIYGSCSGIVTEEIYGSCSGIVTEEQALNPSTPYAVSKAAGDMHLLCMAKHRNFPVAITRPTNVLGAYQQLYRIVPRSIIRIKNGDRIELHGGGKAVKSYLHVQDVCDASWKVGVQGTPGSVYHFSPQSGGIAICDLVKMICDKLGVNFETATTMVDERLGQDAAYVIDSSKARQELGWNESWCLNDAIEEVVQWIESNWEIIQNQEMNYVHIGS